MLAAIPTVTTSNSARKLSSQLDQMTSND